MTERESELRGLAADAFQRGDTAKAAELWRQIAFEQSNSLAAAWQRQYGWSVGQSN